MPELDLGPGGGQGFFSSEEVNIIVFPVMGNYFIGTGNNKFELGGGFLLGSKEVIPSMGERSKSSVFSLTSVIGYRYQKPEGGFLFRVGATPFLALSGGEDAYPDEGLFLSGGVSFGYAF